MKINSDRINEYANSMFRFERLNDAWIDSCTGYLKYLFGDAIKGKTIVDYAFGRGNWAVAFSRAGAEKVIAIDASLDNVHRFRVYCEEQPIKNIKIIHGNLLTDDFEISADLIWLYGILHHIQALDKFLAKVRLFLRDDGAEVYVYYYSRGSLRQMVVEFCRKLFTYSDEWSFRKDSYLYLRDALNRASDDLVAPYIDWATAEELRAVLSDNGLYVKRQDVDFYEYLNHEPNDEFYPVQFLCGTKKVKAASISEREPVYHDEIGILSRLGEQIIKMCKDKDVRRKITVGLFNTHFSALKKNGIKESLREMFLYLMRTIVQLQNDKAVELDGMVKDYYGLLFKSVEDQERTDYAARLGENLFTDSLIHNRVRL